MTSLALTAQLLVASATLQLDQVKIGPLDRPAVAGSHVLAVQKAVNPAPVTFESPFIDRLSPAELSDPVLAAVRTHFRDHYRQLFAATESERWSAAFQQELLVATATKLAPVLNIPVSTNAVQAKAHVGTALMKKGYVVLFGYITAAGPKHEIYSIPYVSLQKIEKTERLSVAEFKTPFGESDPASKITIHTCGPIKLGARARDKNGLTFDPSGTVLDGKIVLFSEPMQRALASPVALSFEDQRRGTIANELGHLIFETLVGNKQYQFTKVLPSGVQVQEFHLNEAFSDLVSLLNARGEVLRLIYNVRVPSSSTARYELSDGFAREALFRFEALHQRELEPYRNQAGQVSTQSWKRLMSEDLPLATALREAFIKQFKKRG